MATLVYCPQNIQRDLVRTIVKDESIWPCTQKDDTNGFSKSNHLITPIITLWKVIGTFHTHKITCFKVTLSIVGVVYYKECIISSWTCTKPSHCYRWSIIDIYPSIHTYRIKLPFHLNCLTLCMTSHTPWVSIKLGLHLFANMQ
jgi:hypothetical protein